MNKKILAVAITSLLATSAQAVMLYENEGVEVATTGDADVQFYRDISEASDQENVIRIDDADFGFSLSYDIGNNVIVGGVLSLSADGDTVDLDKTYISVKSEGMGELTVGKQDTIFDDAGIGSDYEFGLSSAFEQTSGGDQVIKYNLDKGMFYGGVAILLNTAPNIDTDSSAIDAKLGARVAGFDFTGFFAKAKVDNDAGTDTYNVTNYVVEARYAFSDVELAATYGLQDIEDMDKDSDFYGVAATYTMDKTTFGAGYTMLNRANAAGTDTDDQSDYYINAGYAFTGNVKAYVEIGGSDADNTQLGYVAGMQVTF